MADEKIILLNLRKELVEYPKWKRSGRAMSIIRERVGKHAKSGKIKFDKKINEVVWSKGSSKPSFALRLKVTKMQDNSVKVTLME
jgi:large subunit ribosomal protein L31e